MNRAVLSGAAALGSLALLSAAFLPVRASARLERADGNPIQRVALEGRSLFGFHATPFGAGAEGLDHWGSAKEGFFLSPAGDGVLAVHAWPGFHATFRLSPSGTSLAAPAWDQGDREAFRRWFVAIAEDQLERLSPAWEPGQRDCAGLLRFCFREAWGPHDEAWRERLSYTGAFAAKDPDPRFAGPWREAFPTPDGWRPFAKGALLRDLACEPVGRDAALGRPGDLLFFSRGGAHAEPDHAMLFGRTDFDGAPVLIYHTGDEGSGESRDAGAMRRVRLADLLHHPDPEFRPQPENPAFLGVYRWKVLAENP